MRPRFFASLAVFALFDPAAATPPPKPLAVGTYEQIVSVMRAANRCGFNSFNVAFVLMPNGSKPKAVYLAGDEGSFRCIEAWVKRSSRKLGLIPFP